MKFSAKMRLMIILKVTKNQSFTLSLEDTFFEKSQGGPAAVLGLNTTTDYILSTKRFDVLLTNS